MKAKSIAQLAGVALVSIAILAQPLSATNIKFMDRFGGDSRPAITQVYAEEARQVTVKVDGGVVSFPDTQPVIINGRTLVPVRGVFEHLGWDVDWLPEQEAAVLKKGNSTIYVPIGQDRFMIDGKLSEPLDVPAQLLSGRTMLPLRAISEASGNRITWDGDAWTVAIMTKADALFDAGLGDMDGIWIQALIRQHKEQEPGELDYLGADIFNGVFIQYGSSRDLPQYEGYEIKTDLSPTSPLFNYEIYDGEGAPTNVLRSFTEYVKLRWKTADVHTSHNTTVVIRPRQAEYNIASGRKIHEADVSPLSKGYLYPHTSEDLTPLANLTPGQPLKFITSVRNVETGEVASWEVTVDFPVNNNGFKIGNVVLDMGSEALVWTSAPSPWPKAWSGEAEHPTVELISIKRINL